MRIYVRNNSLKVWVTLLVFCLCMSCSGNNGSRNDTSEDSTDTQSDSGTEIASDTHRDTTNAVDTSTPNDSNTATVIDSGSDSKDTEPRHDSDTGTHAEGNSDNTTTDSDTDSDTMDTHTDIDTATATDTNPDIDTGTVTDTATETTTATDTATDTVTTVCDAVQASGLGEVQAPTLRQTLPASWDENWFASPVVADIDNDGDMEIVAARHSVLYTWDHTGTLLWRAAWSYNATAPEDHGTSRMWASPVVGDLDNDGNMEIAVASDASGTSGVNIAVYDHLGQLMSGWPVAFGTTEVRAIAAGDLDGDGLFEIVVNKTGAGPATSVYQLDGSIRAGWPQVNNAICAPPGTG